MSLVKHAAFQVLSARIAQEGAPLMRTAHRVEFEYEPKPGFLYVRSRAISSRCNDNFDEFPAEEIKAAYRTFIGKPVFVNHHNANHRRARGVIIDAALHEDKNPDGTPDTWVEVLMEVDAIRFPKLAEAIVKGHIERTSMGTDVAFSICSACGNKAASPVDYCAHIPRMKGKRIYRTTASGSKEGVLVREICYGLGFFENSLLVEEPADPTAYLLDKPVLGEGVAEALGLRATATRVHASRTEPHHTAPRLALTGRGFDQRTASRRTAGWGVAGEVPAERLASLSTVDLIAQYDLAISTYAGRGTSTNPRQKRINRIVDLLDARADAGDADALAWYGKTSRRTAKDERFKGVGLKEDDDGYYVTTHRARSDSYPTPEDIPDSVIAEIEATGMRTTATRKTAYSPFRLPGRVPGEGDFVRTPDNRLYTVVGVDGDTARVAPIDRSSREPSGPTVRRPLSNLRLDDRALGYSWGYDYARRGFGVQIGADHPNLDLQQGYEQGYQEGWGAMASKTAAKEFTAAGLIAQFGDMPSAIAADIALALTYAAALAERGDYRGSWETLVVRAAGLTSRGNSVGLTKVREAIDHQANLLRAKFATKTADTTMTFDQGGRQVAPAAVDTLRDEQCPVCGETDAYDGDNCSVCGFVKPPEEFGDPDLSKAQQTDLRQDVEEQVGQRLVCPDCGASFVGGTKVAVILDRERGADDSTDVTYAAGDTCPECGKGVLQAQAEDPAAQVDEDGFAPAGSAAEEPDPDFGDDDITEDDVLEDEDDTETSTESEDSEDEDDDDKPDFLKKKKPTAARRGSDSTRRSTVEMARPALEALREQQRSINALARQNLMLRDALVAVATLAGLGSHPRIAALTKRAEDENPAQPDGWATSNGGAEAPAVTTEEAKAPQATDNPESIGASPLTDVTPDATTSVTSTEPVLDEPLSLNEQDPTQPVAGAETLGDGAAGQSGTNRVETDVRIGTPSQEPAFDDASFTASARPIAAMRLARLRIQAGIAEETDDLTLSAKIASSNVTDDAIRNEIAVLSKVVAVRPVVPGQAPARPAPRRLVPQSTHQAVRSVPSLTSEAAVGPEVSTPVSPDEIAFG